MSAPHTPRPDSRLLPVLVTVTYLAAVIAVSGFLSLGLDRDVIDYPDAGPYLGIVMVVAAGLVTWSGCRGVAALRGPWGRAVVTGIGCFAAIVIAGAIGYSLIRASIATVVVSAAHFALSPFTLAAALLSIGAVVGAWAIARDGRDAM
ncbi:hypothetical protein M2152_000083 [Microbacteriaceae bacterium SG_E_30_P1]|uniref:Transmembrane protein n=1 Tax=Antiquaquibacter oligotrophicus TaxID=2880260 RepID=A0ABT6KJ17_9MICO|nr:DUF6121 family protein [Antiquaquibacter oligotrophicus]MDH6179901.1 hypothetical protein [Antiquaquibacter oligotrophicus]UDF14339.1 DUF6121 family protein [Antiquaquibacter oligotrophicus]